MELASLIEVGSRQKELPASMNIAHELTIRSGCAFDES